MDPEELLWIYGDLLAVGSGIPVQRVTLVSAYRAEDPFNVSMTVSTKPYHFDPVEIEFEEVEQ